VKPEDVKVVKGPLVTASAEEVEALEAKLWITFPDGYIDYVTRLGEGYLSDFIRIHPPWRIDKEVDAWRRERAQYWFWDEGPPLLPKARAVECVCIGDTLNGDQLVFHPSRRDRLFVLPRQQCEVFEAGPDLLSAVDWMLRSGRLIAGARRKLQFEAFDSRLEEPDEDDDDDVFGDPVEASDRIKTSTDGLIGEARVWADRRRVHRRADRFFADYLNRGMTRGMTAVRQCEALVFEAETASGYHLGYMAIYKLIDGKTKKAVDSIAFHYSDDGFMGAGPLP